MIKKIFFMVMVMAAVVGAATYYVDNAAATDAGNGTVGSPKKYIPSGIALMSASGGDTCIIIDGTYAGASNNITTFKAGTSGAYNTIMAENDGGVIITASFYSESTTSMYTKVYGLKFVSTVSRVWYPQHCKFFRCSFEGGPACASNCAGAVSLEVGGYSLYEDCWFYGTNGRYVVMVWENHDVVLRRCVVRKDGGYTADEGNPEANFANYASYNVSFQNCISIDNTLTYTGDYQGSFYCTGHEENTNVSNSVAFIGCMSINGQAAAYYVDTDDGSTGMTFTDCLAFRGRDGLAMSNTGVALTINRLTVDSMSRTGIELSSGTMAISNSLIFNHVAVAGSPTVTYTNTYNPSSYSGTGVTHVDPLSNGLLYLPRIEDGSTLKTSGSSGGQMGAQIVYKIGTSGTLYGESGYATATEESLWPWPNEARIKTDMAAVATVGERGFCDQEGTLTNYIMNLLGNGNPYTGSPVAMKRKIVGVITR